MCACARACARVTYHPPTPIFAPRPAGSARAGAPRLWPRRSAAPPTPTRRAAGAGRRSRPTRSSARARTTRRSASAATGARPRRGASCGACSSSGTRACGGAASRSGTGGRGCVRACGRAGGWMCVCGGGGGALRAVLMLRLFYWIYLRDRTAPASRTAPTSTWGRRPGYARKTNQPVVHIHACTHTYNKPNQYPPVGPIHRRPPFFTLHPPTPRTHAQSLLEKWEAEHARVDKDAYPIWADLLLKDDARLDRYCGGFPSAAAAAGAAAGEDE